MNHFYLGAVAFGVTLLVASLALGGKDTDHGGHAHEAAGGGGFGWAPIASLRFWVFLFAFGGGAGLALGGLGSSPAVAAGGALGIGWASGAIAVAVIRSLTRHSVSSELGGAELVGATGTVVLPIGPGKPGKVRVDIKGRIEDYVANVADERSEVGGRPRLIDERSESGGRAGVNDDSSELPTGTAVLIIAEGDRGSLVVAKGEM